MEIFFSLFQIQPIWGLLLILYRYSNIPDKIPSFQQAVTEVFLIGTRNLQIWFYKKTEYWKFCFCGCANSKHVCLPEQTKSDYAFQLGEPVSFRPLIVIVRILMILEMIIQSLMYVTQYPYVADFADWPVGHS